MPRQVRFRTGMMRLPHEPFQSSVLIHLLFAGARAGSAQTATDATPVAHARTSRL